MKLLHLGDLHLGKSLGEFNLIEDQKYILGQILDIIKKEHIDVVMVAGDVYDKAVPSEAATGLLDYFLNSLAGMKATVLMISGNHDSDERLNYGSGLFEANNIYISSKYDGTLYRYTAEDEYGEVDFYLLPFVKASQVKYYFQDEEIIPYEDAVRTILKHTDIDETRRNVIIAHQFVAGQTDPDLGGSESVSVQNVGLVEKISCQCFDAFDYVALGHLHSPQSVGRDGIRYSGSPLKYSFSEVHNKKSVPVVCLGEKGGVGIHCIELEPMRDVRHIKGEMKVLLDKKNIHNTEDFIYATLTDEDTINDAMGIFQQTYPNTIKIDYDNSRTRELEQIDISKIAENRSFSDLIGDFYREIYGEEISEEEMSVMRMAAREAGVIHETD